MAAGLASGQWMEGRDESLVHILSRRGGFMKRSGEFLPNFEGFRYGGEGRYGR